MGFARRRAAVRNGIAAVMMALVLRAAPASSGERPELLLPLVSTIALVSAARATVSQVGAVGPGGRPLLSLLPARLILEDGYEYDPEDYLPPRRSARLLDRDRIVSYDLLRRPRRGWMARVAYDEEGRGPLTGRGDRLSVFAEFRF